MAVKTPDLKKLKSYQTRTVSIKHLLELQDDVEKLKQQNLLDKLLTDEYLKFNNDVAAELPGAQTLIILSESSPITKASFTWQGKVYKFDIPPTYCWAEANAREKKDVTQLIESAGFKVIRARLPEKTLAVRSGLAQYGRNNITYVAGFGSFQRLSVFATDAAFPEDNWGELTMMKTCESCTLCRDNCPTKCITSERFLIHAENCLTFHNERPVAMADWIQPGWHNALIGCLCCQLICPVNKKQLKNIVSGPVFTEAETELLLSRPAPENVPEATRKKVVATGVDYSYEVLGRNLALLIHNQGS
jgi:epoxyqueuosine reductase